MEIRLIRPLALGNGTRKAGFVLGNLDATPAVMISLNCDQFVERMKPADGVTEAELRLVYLNLATSIEIDAAPPEPKTIEVVEDDDFEQAVESWRSIPIKDLKLDRRVAAILKKNKLKTVGDLTDYATENDGFLNLTGIGSSTEETLINKLAGIVPVEE